MLTFGLPVLGLYLPPLIALIAWIVLLVRLRSWVLMLGVGLLCAVILVTSVNPLLATVSNPYLVLVSVLAALSFSFVGRIDGRARRYLIAGYSVCLMMMIALHGWAVMIRQRDLYFYQRSELFTSVWFGSLLVLALAIPVIRILQWWRGRRSRTEKTVV